MILSSFATRISAAVLVTAAIALSAVVGLTVMRLHQGLHRQTVDLGIVSENQLIKTLDGTALLARSQMEHLYQSTANDLRRIANRNDVMRAITSRNVVAISELVGKLSRDVGFDNALVVDPELRVFGAAREDTDILGANEYLRRHAIAREIKADILQAGDSQHALLHSVVRIDDDLMHAIGATATTPMALLVALPVYDDFGEIVAILVAHRAVREREFALEELAKISGGVLIVSDEKVISTAGVASSVGAPQGVSGRLTSTSDGGYWSRCTDFKTAKICAVAPQSELADLRAGMVRVGETESRALSRWLMLVSVIALACLATVTFLLSQQFARPLTAITNAVRAVARGDWKSSLPAVTRKDEIGNIARAVALMQRSLEERDRLKLDVANAETAVKRQEHVETAIRRFDRKMRSIGLSVSEALELINEVSIELERKSALAEGEILEAVFVCRQTEGRLSQTIAGIEALASTDAEFAADDSLSHGALNRHLEQTSDIHASATAARLSTTNLAVSLARIKSSLNEAQETSNALIEKVGEVADGTDRLDLTVKSLLREISDKSLSYPTSSAA